ncbi:MAG: hypothetical protein SXV54_20275 [Chloroflexota bacterium]|nr:hypothetical protein [Chloroflexota bacterium]
MTQKTIPFLGEKAYCPFYALDPDLGFIVASVLTTAQELGLRVAARLVAGQAVVLEDGAEGGIVLKRQKDVEIPLPKDPAQSEEDTPSIRYRASYTRTHPLRLETGVGYETCVLHRDGTMYAAPNHWGYLLRLPGSSEPQFQARFLHLWGRVTGLPARPAWVPSFGSAQDRPLWNMGLKLELIVPLQTFGCEGWRIDPRWDRPDGVAGWREVLKTLVLIKGDA